MKYSDLKQLAQRWKEGYICLFGAGLIGCTWAYDVLKTVGFSIDFFCDNKKKEDIVIRDGIKTISVQKLYSLKDSVLVFITVMDKFQESIFLQLKQNGIKNIVQVDYLFLQIFIESLFATNDENIARRFKFVLSDAEYISQRFEYFTGYPPNLDNPRTFNEKLQWLKLYDYKKEYTKLVDKYMVRQYVEKQIGSEYLTPLLGVWNNFEAIEFEKLPEKFVLKCNHDSGSMVVCRNKDEFQKEIAKQFLNGRLQLNYFWVSREKPYKDVQRKIIAEKFLENTNGQELIDYKFLCANGKVKYIFTCSDRNTEKGLHVNFYETDWRPLPFERHYPRQKKEIEKPKQLEEMIGLAEKLSTDLKFVRVDFYLIDEKIYFSELTFYPGGGMEKFTPEEWDYELGKIIDL